MKLKVLTWFENLNAPVVKKVYREHFCHNNAIEWCMSGHKYSMICIISVSDQLFTYLTFISSQTVIQWSFMCCYVFCYLSSSTVSSNTVFHKSLYKGIDHMENGGNEG